MDLLVLMPDFAFLLNPDLPAEAAPMVRMVGTRLPTIQAHQLSTIAANARPTSERPCNSLLYLRVLTWVQAAGELEMLESMPRMHAATPNGGQRQFRGPVNDGWKTTFLLGR